MSNKDNLGFSDVMNELSEIKEEYVKEWNEDIIKRTISSLLSIEKKALYGSLRGKPKLMENIIINELKNHKELSGVTKED